MLRFFENAVMVLWILAVLSLLVSSLCRPRRAANKGARLLYCIFNPLCPISCALALACIVGVVIARMNYFP